VTWRARPQIKGTFSVKGVTIAVSTPSILLLIFTPSISMLRKQIPVNGLHLVMVHLQGALFISA
jgi:hypothetical protein